MNIKWANNSKLPSHIQNSLDGNEEYDYSEEIDDENLNQQLDDFFESEIAEPQNNNEVISEALKRIEQASLYQTLINHSLFAPNSARPEIMSLVEKEIKAFAIERLEILLGMKNERKIEQINNSQFNPDEIGALKAIASRLMKKPEPQIDRSPSLNVISQTPSKPSPTVAQPPIKAQQELSRPSEESIQTAPKSKSKKSASKKDPSRNYAQAGNPSAMPMPRDIVINQPNLAAGVNVNGVNLSSAVLEHLKKEG